jgi:uridine kinase
MKGPDGRYIRWTDLRLMRRMERDATHRAYGPQHTLEHWHYVRSSEMRNIIPYVNTTDQIVNSGLPYELPVMRARLYHRFEGWVERYQGDPLRSDAYGRALRIRDLLPFRRWPMRRPFPAIRCCANSSVAASTPTDLLQRRRHP